MCLEEQGQYSSRQPLTNNSLVSHTSEVIMPPAKLLTSINSLEFWCLTFLSEFCGARNSAQDYLLPYIHKLVCPLECSAGMSLRTYVCICIGIMWTYVLKKLRCMYTHIHILIRPLRSKRTMNREDIVLSLRRLPSPVTVRSCIPHLIPFLMTMMKIMHTSALTSTSICQICMTLRITRATLTGIHKPLQHPLSHGRHLMYPPPQHADRHRHTHETTPIRVHSLDQHDRTAQSDAVKEAVILVV